MARDKSLPQNKQEKRKEKTLRRLQLQHFAVGRFLIVCEGEKTEPNYFNWYKNELQGLKQSLGRYVKIDGIEIEVARLGDDIIIEGKGKNTKSLVKDALLMIQNLVTKKDKKNKMDYQVWCVFDRDSFPSENFNEAIFLARNNNIHIAYSNEAFELWYLLHYDYHDSAISRTQYQKKLSARLGKPYQKNSATMYEDLLASGGDQQRAINHAKRLLKTYHSELTDYAAHNPSTTVHLLVAALNQFLEDFRKKVDSFQ